MHVEFRCYDVHQVRVLEPESFFRVNQELLRERYKSGGSGHDAIPMLSLYNAEKIQTGQISSMQVKSKYQIEDERMYKPKLQIQFVIDQMIRIESTVVGCKSEKGKDLRAGRVMRKINRESLLCSNAPKYSAVFDEALLAILPEKALNSVVKIRLVQLPPPLRTRTARRAVKTAVYEIPGAEKESMYSPICLGVGKMTLRELLSIRGGIRMTLQAKKGILNILDAIHSSTTGYVSNTMKSSVEPTDLSRKVVCRGATFLLQVVAFSYGSSSLSNLLRFSSSSWVTKGLYTKAGCEKTYDTTTIGQTKSGELGFSQLFHSQDVDEDVMNDGEKSFSALSNRESCSKPNYTIFYFFFIPYLATTDIFLEMNNILSWMKKTKTIAIGLFFYLASVADMFPLALVVISFLILFRFVSVITQLYRYSLASMKRRKPQKIYLQVHSHLYGRQNKLLNAVIRSHLFYQQGLIEESIFEVAFVFHLLRRHQNQALFFCAWVSTMGLLMSVKMLLTVGFILGFFVYPLTLRFSIPHSAKSRWKRLFSSSYLLNSLQLNRPLNVTAIAYESQTSIQPCSGLPRRVAPTRETEMEEYFNTSSQSGCHGFHSETANDASPLSLMNQQNLSSQVRRQQKHNASKLTFVAISLTSCVSNGTEDTQMFLLLRSYWKHIRVLHSIVGKRYKVSSSGVFTSAEQSERSAAIWQLYAAHVKKTLDLLTYIRNQTALQAYVTKNSCMPVIPNSSKRLETIIQSDWLLEEGEDDSVTPCFLAVPDCGCTVWKMPETTRGSTTEAQALAAFAAYLLQGARLSIYARGRGNRNCCVILPLQPGSNFFERYPCLASQYGKRLGLLVGALEEIWQNKYNMHKSLSSRKTQPLNPSPKSTSRSSTPFIGPLAVTSDMVLQVVQNHLQELNKEVLETKSGMLPGRWNSLGREASHLFPAAPLSTRENEQSVYHSRMFRDASGHVPQLRQSPRAGGKAVSRQSTNELFK